VDTHGYGSSCPNVRQRIATIALILIRELRMPLDRIFLFPFTVGAGHVGVCQTFAFVCEWGICKLVVHVSENFTLLWW
jgi:hypothetical protein